MDSFTAFLVPVLLDLVRGFFFMASALFSSSAFQAAAPARIKTSGYQKQVSFDLGDVGEFINDNPQIPIAAALMAGQATPLRGKFRAKT
jgi:hypothetical protein